MNKQKENIDYSMIENMEIAGQIIAEMFWVVKDSKKT